MIYPLVFPAKAPNSQRLTISRKQSPTESNFTYVTQIVHSASQWSLQWSWGACNLALAESLGAWLDALNGQVGTFRYYPRSLASGITGRSLASPAYPYSDTLVAGGWGANAASGLRTGQYFQLGTQLLRVTGAGAFADANGRVTITFAPELRSQFAAGAGLNFTNPCGEFRLNSSDGAGFTLTPDRKPELGTYQAREVI